MRIGRRGAATAVAAALLAACAGGEVRMAGEEGSPRQTYAASLQEAGLHRTALGREWIEAADRALADPTAVELPHREVRWLDPREASAVAFRIPLESGQRLVVDALVSGHNPSGITLFLDLFREPERGGAPDRVASADSARWHLEHVVDRSGSYLLRVQPELLRGGRVTVTMTAEASLAFPLPERDLSVTRSPFGDVRRGGRAHEGIDLLAPRGTPVLASAPGTVERAGTEREGGKVVWLRDEEHGRRLYYAHLEGHAVERGARVRVGDTLGFVGNSGNAQTTRPHLHFGIYYRGRGPVDPASHLRHPPRDVPDFTADANLLGRWARVTDRTARLRAHPDPDGDRVARLAGHTPVRVEGGSGAWYAVRLPDGRAGYLPASELVRLDPLRDAGVGRPVPLRTSPSPDGELMDSLPRGERVAVLGNFGDHALVRHGERRQGWLPSEGLGPPATSAVSDASGAGPSP